MADSRNNTAFGTLFCPVLLSGTLPHSHSIVLGHGNALIFCRKFFLRTPQNRLCDPSEICAFDFKKEFRQSENSSV
jgi:hypothetical protein